MMWRGVGGPALGAVLSLLVPAHTLPGQGRPAIVRPEPGRFEVPGLDFRPDGAWRKGTERVRERRRSLLRQGKLARLNAAGGAGQVQVAGTFRIPVLPIAFPNVPPPFPSAQYQSVLFDPVPSTWAYSVRSYYAEQSRGRVTIDGEVRSWVLADSSDLYYEDGCNGVFACPHGGQRLGQLLLEALSRNDDGLFDWGRFDNDGPDGLPNSGDDDGVVDVVMFLQPEVDGACRTSNLWAHRFVVRGWTGAPYRTRSPRRDAQGQPLPGQFIVVDDYTLQSAVGGADACTPGVIMAIGTTAHETGHAFGLPDLYDTNFLSPSGTQGIGEWGIMGSGNYTKPYSPAAFEAWSLAELGWVAVDTLGSDRYVTLAPVATSDTVLYVPVPNTDEYFLFENRQAIGSDTAQMNPACLAGTRSCAKGGGLLVWHIDEGQIALHGFRADNRVNVGPVHGVALVQADGREDLRTPGSKNRGDPGDPYPGSSGNIRLGLTTLPAAVDNQGAGAGFELDSIAQLVPGGAVGFRFTRTAPGQVYVDVAQAAKHLLGQPVLGPAQLGYLDASGNGNGRYDVGDFLRLVRAGPAPGSAPLRAAAPGRLRRAP
jgi:M6 family metalloprotease-like protein